ncbi:MAG: aldehyde reductase [Pseudomonadota bacterium]
MDRSSITVLVTGATGFIGKHTVLAALDAGYKVRGTVRRLASGENVRAVVHAHAKSPDTIDDQLSFVEADLTRDDGWAAAVDGCAYVLHVASPFPLREPKNREDVIAPARDGALRVLKAAAASDVVRTVLTSSVVAVMYPTPEPGQQLYNESHWTAPQRDDVTAYVASKAIAERAAWDFIDGGQGALQLNTVNPGLVLGPALDDDMSSSVELITMMAKGQMPAVPRVAYPVVDVRDVAAMHLVAMEHPQATGERFICSAGMMPLMQIGRIIARELPDLRWKTPKVTAPDWLVRAGSLIDPSAKAVLADLGRGKRLDNAKSKRVLGFTYRSNDAAVSDCVRSLRALKLV